MGVKKSQKGAVFFYSPLHGYSYNKNVITNLFNRLSIEMKGGLKK